MAATMVHSWDPNMLEHCIRYGHGKVSRQRRVCCKDAIYLERYGRWLYLVPQGNDQQAIGTWRLKGILFCYVIITPHWGRSTGHCTMRLVFSQSTKMKQHWTLDGYWITFFVLFFLRQYSAQNMLRIKVCTSLQGQVERWELQYLGTEYVTPPRLSPGLPVRKVFRPYHVKSGVSFGGRTLYGSTWFVLFVCMHV